MRKHKLCLFIVSTEARLKVEDLLETFQCSSGEDVNGDISRQLCKKLFSFMMVLCRIHEPMRSDKCYPIEFYFNQTKVIFACSVVHQSKMCSRCD